MSVTVVLRLILLLLMPCCCCCNQSVAAAVWGRLIHRCAVSRPSDRVQFHLRKETLIISCDEEYKSRDHIEADCFREKGKLMLSLALLIED